MTVTVKAAAKINLFLDILSRLDDGYHSLFMIMQSLDLYDTVTVKPADSIKIGCSAPEIPTDENNIAFKAARAFLDACEINGGADIYIEKQIPFAAGLAGGSADGAAVIAALNEIYGTGLSLRELCEIGIKVGADVPFCLTGGLKLSQDIGGVLSDLPPLPECYFVLAKPGSSVSTKEAYAQFDKCEKIYHPNCPAMLHAAVHSDFNGMMANARNIFEQFVEVPKRVEIKNIMRKYNAKLAQMSGSGPTIFGIFLNKKYAEICAEELQETVRDVFVCSPSDKALIIEKS
ncbi:MAG: 4-(cytidine 5'-diphospho)-2-C-methyl-D-erythritol kinase [Clostridiales bacterium]|nr:4-(cytidine 5'-diphospho)-2-C-methyl-D-erythritol kinase [Clostridiales bacterium]